MSFDFQGKSVLITGGGNGLGQACAHEFAKAGAQVVVVDINEEVAQSTVNEIKANGGDAVAYRADVSSAAEVEAMVAFAVATYGKLDVAVNNAGIASALQPLAETQEADYDRVMSVNVKGVWLCMREELKVMEKQGHGAIVNMASALSHNTYPGATFYVTSKFAVLGMTRNAGVEYAEKNIRINAVCPGNVATPLVISSVEDPSALATLHANKRLGTTDEIANAVMFMASDLSTFCVGTSLIADGGWTAV